MYMLLWAGGKTSEELRELTQDHLGKYYMLLRSGLLGNLGILRSNHQLIKAMGGKDVPSFNKMYPLIAGILGDKDAPTHNFYMEPEEEQ